MKFDRILLATDLSESADRALKQAVELAAQGPARLEIFHALRLDGEESRKGIDDALESYLAKVEKEIFDDLSTRSDALRTRGVAVEVVTRRGRSPAEAILDRIQETRPDLVVVGTRGRSGVQKLLLGSVAARVVQKSPAPVVTVGKDAVVAEGEAGFDPILVPLDFTEYSKKAVEAAQRFLAPSGRLLLQHVVPSPVYPSFYAEGLARPFQASPDLPDRIRAKLEGLYGGSKELLVSEGNVVEDVLNAASSRKAQMIVMGTRGLSGLEQVLLGSVTERIIQRAPVPVVAVK